MLRRCFVRKVNVICLALLILLLAATAALSGEFWGSIKSDVYHYPDCRYAKKIDPRYLLKFASPEQARDKGYRPCKVCRPPYESDGAEDGRSSRGSSS